MQRSSPTSQPSPLTNSTTQDGELGKRKHAERGKEGGREGRKEGETL